MIGPTLHLNGTSFNELFEQYSNAIEGLRRAEKDLLNMSPNQRDYYLQPNAQEAWHAAKLEHQKRLLAINIMVLEIETLREDLVAQNDKRARR